MTEMSGLIILSKLSGARHQSSLTCSTAIPQHLLAEGASANCSAIWMRPSAAVPEGLAVLPGECTEDRHGDSHVIVFADLQGKIRA